MAENLNNPQNPGLNIAEVSKHILLNQLDKWIKDCENQAEIFRENKMDMAEISSQAMGQAYWNVKQFIDLNTK